MQMAYKQEPAADPDVAKTIMADDNASKTSYIRLVITAGSLSRSGRPRQQR